MKLIIAGSRSIEDMSILLAAAGNIIEWPITEVVSGGAKGVDRLGELWAQKRNIPITRFPAEWNKYGKRAGYIRNKEMALYADALLAIWDGESKGTKHMIDSALEQGLWVCVYRVGKYAS